MQEEQGAEPVLLPWRRKPSIAHLVCWEVLQGAAALAQIRSLLLGFSRDVRGLNEMVILSNMCCSSVCTVKWRLSQFQASEQLLPLRGMNGSGRSRSPAAPLVCGWRTPAPTRGQAKTYNVCWGFQPSSRSGWWERLLRAVAWIQPRSRTWNVVRCWNPAVGCSARRPADGQETASFGFRS